jgi:hypothetical protein
MHWSGGLRKSGTKYANSFKLYMLGVKANWNVFDWNKSKKEKDALSFQATVTTEKEPFA